MSLTPADVAVLEPAGLVTRPALSSPPGFESMTVAEYLRFWLDHMRFRVRPTTYDGYRGMCEVHAIPRIGSVPLADLHPLVIQRMYTEVLTSGRVRGLGGLAARSVLHLHRILKEALAQAVRWQIIATNPAAGAQPPRPARPELTIVDPDLARRVLAAAVGTRFHTPVALGLGTGMRRGEILGLQWVDVEVDTAVLRVRRTLQVATAGLAFQEPKTFRSRRSITLPEFLLEALEVQRWAQATRRAALGRGWHEQGLVIDGGDGGPWDPDVFSAQWGRFVREGGLPHIRFHDLRHAHATLMLVKGVHPKIVSERLGHSTIAITLDIYSHVIPSMQNEAARMVDEVFSTGGDPAD
jgi:integrase